MIRRLLIAESVGIVLYVLALWWSHRPPWDDGDRLD